MKDRSQELLLRGAEDGADEEDAMTEIRNMNLQRK